MAQSGLSRAIYPVHTPLDGDVVFAAGMGAKPLPDPVFSLKRTRHARRQCSGARHRARYLRSDRSPVSGRAAKLARSFRMKQNQNGRLRVVVACHRRSSLTSTMIGKAKRLKVTFVTGRTFEYIDVPAEVAASFPVGLLEGHILQRLHSRPLRFSGNHARARR